MEGIGERKLRLGANLKRLLNAALSHEGTMLHEKYDGKLPTLLLAAENISDLNQLLKKMLVYKNTRQQNQTLRGWNLE